MIPFMSKSNQYLIAAACTAGIISCLYFLLLLVCIPFLVTVMLSLAAGTGVFFFLFRNVYKEEVAPQNVKMEWLPVATIVATLGFLCVNIKVIALKYGGWDAMCTWNLHAQYLADPVNWQKMFQNSEYSHPDYPLCLPAIIAFFMRLFSADGVLMVPFIVCVTLTLSMPVLIYQEVAHRQGVVAIGAMVLFVMEHYYIAGSVNQYADVVVAFFLLCAFICAAHMYSDKRYVALSVFFIACCAWTKNEGIVLALIFLLWHGRSLFSKTNIMHTLAGLALPLGALLVFKLVCHTPNDLVNEANSSIVGYLGQPGRYIAVASSYRGMITKEFQFTAMALVVFAVICVLKKKMPGGPFFMLVTYLVVYSMVYVVTPKDISWHLTTSHSRLVLQLMPVLIYVMADHLSSIAFTLPRPERAQ